jgi:hypothetical protein
LDVRKCSKILKSCSILSKILEEPQRIDLQKLQQRPYFGSLVILSGAGASSVEEARGCGRDHAAKTTHSGPG